MAKITINMYDALGEGILYTAYALNGEQLPVAPTELYPKVDPAGEFYRVVGWKRLENKLEEYTTEKTLSGYTAAATLNLVPIFEVGNGATTSAHITWTRTAENDSGSNIGKVTTANWKWSNVANLDYSQTENVWDGAGNNHYYKDYTDGKPTKFDSATWKRYTTGSGTNNSDIRRFRGTFTIPVGYSVDDKITISAVDGSGKIPINDNIYFFIYPQGASVDDTNFMNYFAFWTGTIKNHNSNIKFNGKSPTNPTHGDGEGPFYYTDGWHCDAVTDNIGAVMLANYPYATNDTVWVVDVFVEDYAAGGGMSRLDLNFERVLPSTSVTIKYYKDQIIDTSDYYLGNTVMKGVTESQKTILPGTAEGQLNWLRPSNRYDQVTVYQRTEGGGYTECTKVGGNYQYNIIADRNNEVFVVYSQKQYNVTVEYYDAATKTKIPGVDDLTGTAPRQTLTSEGSIKVGSNFVQVKKDISGYAYSYSDPAAGVTPGKDSSVLKLYYDKLPEYKVTFKTDGNGTLTADGLNAQGEKVYAGITKGTVWRNADITVPETTANTSYEFSHWAAPNGRNYITVAALENAYSNDAINSDLTFTAVFRLRPTYKVVFIAEGTEFAGTDNAYRHEATVYADALWAGNVTVPGYTEVAGKTYVWTNIEGDAGFDNPKTGVPANYRVGNNLTFKLTATTNQYTVRFVVNGVLVGKYTDIPWGTAWNSANPAITIPQFDASDYIIESNWAVTVENTVEEGYAATVAHDPNANKTADLAIKADLTFNITTRERATDWEITFKVADTSNGMGALLPAGASETGTTFTYTVIEGLPLSENAGWSDLKAVLAAFPPDAIYEFVNWTGPNGTYTDAIFSGTYVPQADGETIEANFLRTQKYKLTYHGSDSVKDDEWIRFPSENNKPLGIEYYLEGELVTVKSAESQMSNSGKHYFLGWTSNENHSGVVMNNNDWNALKNSGTYYEVGKTFNMQAADLDLYPVFGNRPYNGTFVAFDVDGPGGFDGYTADKLPIVFGGLTAGVEFSAADVTVPTPQANSKAYFVGWFVDDVKVDAPTSATKVPATGVTYVAKFAPQTPLVLTAPSASREYNGNALTAPYVKENDPNWDGDEGIAKLLADNGHILVIGSVPMIAESTITNKGSVANVIDPTKVDIEDTVSGESVLGQYDLTLLPGTLAITLWQLPEDAQLVYKWVGKTVTYNADNQTHTDDEGELYIRENGEDTLFDAAARGLVVTHLSASASGKDVKRDAALNILGYEMKYEGGIALSHNSEDVTASYGEILYLPGELKINPVELTLRAIPTTVKYPEAAELTFAMNDANAIPVLDRTGDKSGIDYMADLNALFGMTGTDWLTSGYDPATYTGTPDTFDILFTTTAHNKTKVTDTPKNSNYLVTLVDSKVDSSIIVTVTDAYTVTYYPMLDGADVTRLPAPKVYNANAPVSVDTTKNLLTHPDGYVLTGWRTKGGEFYPADDTQQGFVMPADNVNLYAVWSFDENTFSLDVSSFDKVYDGIEGKTALRGPLVTGDKVSYTLSDGTVYSYSVGDGTTPYEFASTDVVNELITVRIERTGIEPVIIERVQAQIRHREITVGWGTEDKLTYNGVTQNATDVTGGVTDGSIAGTDSITYGTPAGSGLYAGDDHALTFAAGSGLATDGEKKDVHVLIVRGNSDATKNYIITEEPGTFTIDKMVITVRSGDNYRAVYDGSPLFQVNYVVENANGPDIATFSDTATNIDALFAEGARNHLLTLTVNGLQVEVGSSENTFDKSKSELTYSAKDGDVDLLTGDKASVTIKYIEGNLVVAGEATIVLDTNSLTLTYDATSHEVTGYAIQSGTLANGHKINPTISAKSGKYTNVGNYPNKYSGKPGNAASYVLDAQNNPVGNNYEVVFNETGKLVINKRKAAVLVIPEIVTYNGRQQSFTKNYIGIPDIGVLQNNWALFEKALKIAGVDMPDVSSEIIDALADVMGWLGLKDTGFVSTGLFGANTHVAVGTATATGKNVGAYRFQRDNLVIRSYFNAPWVSSDVTANYEIIEIPSYLLITPAKITISTKGAEKVYDGTALTKDAFTVTYDGNEIYDSEVAGDARFSDAFAGHSVGVFAINGSRTDVGTSKNSIQKPEYLHTYIKANATDYLGLAKLNFLVTYSFGDLKVTERDVTLTVDVNGEAGGTASKVYDGSPLSLGDADVTTGLTVTGLEGMKIPVTVSNMDALLEALKAESITYVHEGDENGIVPVPTNPNDLVGLLELTGSAKANFKFEVKQGNLKITPATIVLTANTASKTYNNTELVEPGYTVSYGNVTKPGSQNVLAELGFVGEHYLDAWTEGSITDFVADGVPNRMLVDSIMHADEVSVYGREDEKDSILVELVNGTLSINRRVITVRARSSYGNVADGTVHSVNGYDIDAPTTNTGLLSGHSLTGVSAFAERAGIGISTVPVNYTNWQVVAGNDSKTNNYTLIPVTGILEVVAPGEPIILPVLWPYSVQYWADAVGAGEGGTLLGTFFGSVPEGGGAAMFAIADYQPAVGYEPGTIVDGRTRVERSGDVFYVLYLAEEEPVEEPIIPITPPDPDEPEPTEPEEPVNPEPNPIVVPEVAWALLNLMIAVLSLVFGVMLVFGLFMRNKKKEEQSEEAQEAEETERNPKSGLGWRILAILAGIAAPIVFFITENMRNPMIFVDKWTPLMVIILVVQVIGMLLLRRARNQEDENDEAESEA